VRSAHNGKWDNANPRGQAVVDKYVKTTSPEIQARYERAKAAHNNLLENAPLFIGAIVIGNFVGLPTSECLLYKEWDQDGADCEGRYPKHCSRSVSRVEGTVCATLHQYYDPEGLVFAIAGMGYIYWYSFLCVCEGWEQSSARGMRCWIFSLLLHTVSVFQYGSSFRCRWLSST
jgi:hypothetical protein